MFSLILFLISSCFELSNGVQWKCNDPVNDICSSNEVLSRLEDSQLGNENYRLLNLSQTVAIERNLSSKYPIPIIQLKNATLYQICPNKNQPLSKTEDSKEHDTIFQNCIKTYCASNGAKSTTLECNVDKNLQLQELSNTACLNNIKNLVVKPIGKNFNLVSNNFFKNAANLEELSIVSDVIKLGNIVGLFGYAQNLKVLKMPKFEYTLPAQIIRENGHVLMVETKTNRAWNMCSRIETIDLMSGNRVIDKSEGLSFVKAIDEQTRIIVKTYDDLIPKVRHFFNSLTYNEIILCVVILAALLCVIWLIFKLCRG